MTKYLKNNWKKYLKNNCQEYSQDCWQDYSRLQNDKAKIEIKKQYRSMVVSRKYIGKQN